MSVAVDAATRVVGPNVAMDAAGVAARQITVVMAPPIPPVPVHHHLLPHHPLHRHHQDHLLLRRLLHLLHLPLHRHQHAPL